MNESSSQRRYLSLWLRRLATDRLSRGGPGEDPLVVTRMVKSALRLVAMNDAAQRLGLRTGMPLADARAMYPGLAVAESDEETDRRLLETIADWCDRYTPLVGLDAPDGLVLDISGCAHLFGGEAAMCRDMLARLARQGLQARAAVADTVGCAFAAARYGSLDVVPPDRMGEILAPLPVATLRLAPATVEALAGLGLKRIADLVDLPRAPLAARFGESLIRRLDQALGRLDEPITPRLPVPVYMAEQRFADPIGLERDVLATITRLATQLAAAMERRQDGARLMQVALFRADNKVYRIEVGTGAPLRDAARITRLFTDRLAVVGEACDPGFGFDMVRLTALVTERSEPVQTGTGQAGLDGSAEDDAEFGHLVDRLGARFGLRRVTRLVEQDTHIPELAVAAMPAHAVKVDVTAWDSPAESPLSGSGAHAARDGGSKPETGSTFFAALSGAPEDRASQGRSSPVLVDPGVANRGVACGTPYPSVSSPPAGPRPGSGRRNALAAALAAADLRAPHEEQDSLAPTRPVRLFGRPEPVEAIAEVPDGPPARFRWRRVLHEVAAVEGPERIAMEWWRAESGPSLIRDYFRVESRDGLRVWLYREGLYGAEPAPRWFLHGLFG